MALSKTNGMSTSIVICSRNRRRQLESLVENLTNMQLTGSLELIVVEETDSPIPIDSVIYVPHQISNRGIPFARNLGLAHATGEIIVFLDDDCRLHDGWLENLLEPFQDESVVGVQGGVTVPSSTNAVGWAESILGFPGGGIRRVLEAEQTNSETRHISTLNCAYRRWVIDKIGGFDERLKLGCEDYLLAKQACNHGRCLFVPHAMVSHEARGSLIHIWHWFVRRGRAEMALMRRVKLREDSSLWTVVRGSLTIKICFLILIGLASPALAPHLFAVALLAYCCTQYVRNYRPWKDSSTSRMALVILPLVKTIMDAAMDWGRFRGLVFD